MDSTRNRTLLGVAIGHGAHDAWYGVAPILLASLSAGLGLANQDIALMLLLYQSLSSITQPFFGSLAERIGGRPLAVASILWTTLLFSGTLFVESKILLGVLIFLAGLGSGAWHPQGTANATMAGGARWGATAASTFFLGGTVGSAFLGSALGGWLLGTYDRRALLVISAITVLLALTAVRAWVPRWLAVPKRAAANPRSAAGSGTRRAFWGLLALLLVATALRSFAQHAVNTFVPKFQQDMGVSPNVYGLLMSLNLFGAAVGGVAGAYLADRVGMRRILVITLLLGGGALFVFMQNSSSLLGYAAFVLAGLFYGPSHTLLVVSGQRQFPDKMAMMSGFFLGFTFVSGAGGAWVLGLLADRHGLPDMLGYLPWALLLAAVFAFLALPRRDAPSPEPVPQGRVAEQPGG